MPDSNQKPEDTAPETAAQAEAKALIEREEAALRQASRPTVGDLIAKAKAEARSQGEALAMQKAVVEEGLGQPMGNPTIGRVVHYRSYGSPGGEYKSKPIAAVITEVEYYPEASVQQGIPGTPTGRVGLFIMNPTGVFFKALSDGGCTYGAHAGGWSWPPRV